MSKFLHWWRELRVETRSDGGVQFFGGLLLVALMGLAFLMASTEAEPIREDVASSAPAARR